MTTAESDIAKELKDEEQELHRRLHQVCYTTVLSNRKLTVLQPVKKWFAENKLDSVHGDFPVFWQDLVSWEPWKEVYKSFLASLDSVPLTTTKTASPTKKRKSRYE